MPKKAETWIADIKTVSQTTGRVELFWLNGTKKEVEVFRVPTKHLYFNIENGRYADKMLQLKGDHPGADIDPREPQWSKKIALMLRGEYTGTESDREPFDRLRRDLEAREQLRPGVVLEDGAVLDGNRRLAALQHLETNASNSARYAYLDAVILPGEVSAADRWRIEAGLQLGKDEQHDYSAINRLLKIREGLELFKGEAAKKPEELVADALYGVRSSEIGENIQRIRLIDEYLTFIKRPGRYNEIGDRMERFIEAVKILGLADQKQWDPQRRAKLKTALFAHIRDTTMDNWELRKVFQAMGPKKKPENERAVKEFLTIDKDIEEVRKALSATKAKSDLRPHLERKAQDFKDIVEAADAANEPVRLATRAKENLIALADSLDDTKLSKHDGWEDIVEELPTLLTDVQKAAQQCVERSKKLIQKSGAGNAKHRRR